MALAEPRIRTELKSTLKWHMRASFLYRGGQDEGQDNVTHIERGPLIRGFLKWAEGDQNPRTRAGEALGAEASTGGKRTAELCETGGQGDLDTQPPADFNAQSRKKCLSHRVSQALEASQGCEVQGCERQPSKECDINWRLSSFIRHSLNLPLLIGLKQSHKYKQIVILMESCLFYR